MQSSSGPGQINQLQTYRPACTKCGGATTLARIEPANELGHDLRTFECTACGHTDIVKMRFG